MRKEVTLWPLVQYEGQWSVPDHLLLDIWGILLDKGLDKTVFYDGTVQTGLQWLNYLKLPTQFVVFGVDVEKTKFLGMGWLSNIWHGAAETHFCYFDKYILGGGEKIIDFWEKNLKLKVLYGHIPESNEIAIKIAKRLGFTEVGIIPNCCDMIYKNIREGAVVLYHQLEG